MKYQLIFSSFIIQVCMGSLYSWSVFQKALWNEPYQWSKLATNIPFSINVFVNPIVMIFAGSLYKRYGPKTVSTMGGILLGTGWMISGLIDLVNTEIMGLLLITVFFGIISSIGIGFSYPVIVSVLSEWFPQRKGLAMGVAVAGFGLGSFFIIQIERILISVHPEGRIGPTFFILGFSYLIIVVILSQLLKSLDFESINLGFQSVRDHKPIETLKTKNFWILWTAFTLSISAGIMAIGNIISVVEQQITNPEIDIIFLGALLGGLIAVSNACGRIFWGGISDKIGRLRTMRISFFIVGIAMILFILQTEVILLIVFSCLIGFGYGGNFASIPAVTGDYFGQKYLAINFGMMFTSVSAAGIIGPTIASILTYTESFILLGIFSFISIGLIFVINHD